MKTFGIHYINKSPSKEIHDLEVSFKLASYGKTSDNTIVLGASCLTEGELKYQYDRLSEELQSAYKQGVKKIRSSGRVK